ncbi:adenylate cyclase [Pararhizobium sp. PWRC1-1]|uniref:adenylate cyclase n=1 Tax=Pararhizobium sp. PWRC1-1 TaxID=2804566 RepID=UPI003CF41492
MQTSVPDTSEEAQPLERPCPSPDEIRGQLARILESPEFPSVGRVAAFLNFVIEEALAGRAQRLKGYLIAVEVFKRREGFTQDDPVVRIEAGRLRRILERYYLVAGQHDPVRIDIPKGGYAPSFTWNEPPAATTADGGSNPLRIGRLTGSLAWLRERRWSHAALAGTVCLAALAYWGTERFAISVKRANYAEVPAEPTLVIAPFENLGDGPQARLYTAGLTEELLTALPRFKEIKVFGRETSKSLSSKVDVSVIRGDLGAHYLLSGGVRVSGSRVRVTARLHDTSDGAILWSQDYEDDLSTRELFTIQTDVANKVATAVAQPYGIIAQARTAHPPPDDLGVYDCTLRFYAYRTDLGPDSHLKARDCLERSTARYPAYSTAWAMLSIAYLDEGRFRFNPKADPTPPMERALTTARRAIDLEPDNTRALQALMTALFFNRQLAEALEVGGEALRTNPNDTELLGEFGTRVAMSGQWKRGAALLDQALALNPGGAGYYDGTRALAAYMLNDQDKAVRLIRKADLQRFPLFHAVAAAIYADAGMMDDAKREAATFMKMRPEYIDNIVEEHRNRNIQPADSLRMIASLRKAGLPVPAAKELDAELSLSDASPAL